MKNHLLFKPGLAAIGLLLTAPARVHGQASFNPVSLTPASYTYGIVVPSNTVQAVPYCINALCGSGQCLTCDNTFYEQGMYARPGQMGYNSGIPRHDTILTNINNTNMTFLMPPDYTTNNDLMIVKNTTAGYGSITSGTFLFGTPTTATNLAFLCTDGNGAMSVAYTVTHSDGSTDSGSIAMLDWFTGGATVAWGANGRMDENGDFNNYDPSAANNNVPYLYANKITVSGASPISRVAFRYSTGTSVANFFAVSGNASGAEWTPIPVSGFNIKSIIPAAVPFPVTATMDNGTNVNEPGNTWFEEGYYQLTPSDGLPPSGSTFTSVSQPTHTYQMGDYASNNAVLIDVNHLSASMTPSTPAAYSGLALLTTGANIGAGEMDNLCILQHQDGVKETNLFFAYDWFNTSVSNAVAWNASGRVNLNNRTLNDLGDGTPKLFESYFAVSDSNSPVTNIVVQYGSAPAGNSTTFIMAVSGANGPIEPLISAGALPATQTWYPSQTATFSVLVSGTPPMTNSWLVENNGVYVPLTDGTDANGSVISGSSTTTLTISGLTLADGTNYEYVASNVAGSATSAPALLIMNSGTPNAPIIDSQAPDASVSTLTVYTNLPNRTNFFSVVVDASSAPPLYYQWYSGYPPSPANAIADATNATYASVDMVGVTISCLVSNFVGTAESSPVELVAGALAPYQSALLPYHPVSYWPLNETGGTVAFDIFGYNNGTYEGGCTLGQTGLPATGGIGANTSVAFDGSSGFVDIPVGNLNITGPMTVIEWVQTTGETGFTTSIGHTDSGWRLDVDQSGDPHFADAGPDAISPTAITDGNWHQLVGTYDGTTQTLYVDSKSVAHASGKPPTGSGDDVWIGGAPDYGGRFFAGNIAQVAVLSNALTAAQVAAVYYSLLLPPSVFVTPANPLVDVGDSVALTANVNGTPPIGLHWYFIDDSSVSNSIPEATNATYTITDAQLSLSGYTYGVIATNLYGTNLASVGLTVQNSAPVLLPGGDLAILNGVAYVGAPVTYTVEAGGTLPIYYQWLINGVAVSGATNSSFTAPAGCGANTIQVSMTNSFSAGTPTLSSLATLDGEAYPTNVTFNTDGTGWQLNGSVQSIASNVLELTDGGGGEASSAFYNTPQYVGNFRASFTYTAGGGAAADGVAFIIQDSAAGTTALGATGGSLGYFQISPSIALEIDLYNSVGIAPSTNGLTAASSPSGLLYGPTGGVAVNSGDPINFQLDFANGVMAVTLTDATTAATYSTNYTFGSLTDLLAGTDLAYVGFSGADGGATSIQTISNFVFAPVISPMTLAASHATGSSVVLSWPSADPNWVLQESADLLTWAAGPTPVVVSGVNQVTVTASSSAQMYYRLVRIVCP